MTPAASAISSIEVAWKPGRAKQLARDLEELLAALVGGQPHRGRAEWRGQTLDFSGIT